MKYVVFDLEFNQGFDYNLNKTVPNEKCPFEIIQIGAIKLDSKFKIIDTFNRYVKPQVYKKIHPFISKITKINSDTIKDAKEFKFVYNEFKNFLGDDKITFCTWGGSDLKELFRNINYYNLEYKSFPNEYINIQKYASSFFNNPSGKSIGLENAIKLIDIKQDKSYHDALNDAYYATQIFIRIHNKKMLKETCNYNTNNKNSNQNNEKKYIDYNKLFLEFRKILGRDLTKEEEYIIDLSYKMGKTGQFLTNKSIYKRR